MSSKEMVLAKTTVALALTSRSTTPKDAARNLLALSEESRALALASGFSTALEQLPAKEATDGAERLGRQLEAIIDEMPEQEVQGTLSAMIEAGDTTLLLYMLRGNASGVSTVSSCLTEEMLEELFAKDADLAEAQMLQQKDSHPEERADGESKQHFRNLSLVTTLTQNSTRTILLFLKYNEIGRKAMNSLWTLALQGNEDAEHVLTQIRSEFMDMNMSDTDSEMDD